MFDFFIGLLVGAIIMDMLWAWKTGVFTMIRLNYKVWRVRRRNAKRASPESATLDDLFD
jgi:hypothetical protein